MQFKYDTTDEVLNAALHGLTSQKTWILVHLSTLQTAHFKMARKSQAFGARSEFHGNLISGLR